MSLFNTSSGQSANLYGQSASPSLLWTFNGTFIESITGINYTTGGTNGVNPFAAGLYGQALYMQTAASYQQYLYTLSSSLSTTNGFTASAWINSAGDTGDGIGIYGPTVGTFTYLVKWGTRSGGYPYVEYYDPNNGYLVFRIVQSDTILPYNNWYNIGFVLGGSTNKTLTLYVNGVQKGITTYGEDIAYGGMNIFRNGNFAIQDLRIYNTALTAAQVQSIYNQSAVPVTSISLTGTPLFSQISSAARSSAVGAFSLRAVNGTSPCGTALAVNVVPGGTFPPSLMTPAGGTNLSTQTLGTGVFQGSYTASSSINAFGWGAPGAFSGTDIWQVSTYPPAPGGTVSTPTTTTTASVNYNGDWLQLQTPFGINLTGYSVGTGYLTQVVLLGSTTGGTSSWTLIDSQTTITDFNTITRTGLSTSAFTYFRFVIITSTAAYPLLGAVKFTGYAPSLARDFYADRLGNLLTAPVTGQTLSSWLGGATGYVATWYDQSGQGNHMSCSSTGIQPKIDLTNNWIDFKPSACFDTSANPTAGPSPWDSTKNYTVTCHHNTITGGICGSFDSVGGNGNNKTNNFQRIGANYIDSWYNNDAIGGTYAVGNKVSFKWDGTNRYIYGNGTLQATIASSGWTQTSSASQSIGRIAGGGGAVMNGEMYSIFMFNTALSDADRALVEAAS